MTEAHNPWPDFELLDLLLEREGMARSPDVWFYIHALLLSRISDNQKLSTPAEFARLIGPLVCKSPQQQQRVESVIREWLTGEKPDKTTLITPSTASPAKSSPPLLRRFEQHYVLAVLALFCLLFVIIRAELFRQPDISPPITPPIIGGGSPTPPPIPTKIIPITDSVKPNPLPMPVEPAHQTLIYRTLVFGVPFLGLLLYLIWRYLPQVILRKQQQDDDQRILGLQIKDLQHNPDIPFGGAKIAADLSPLMRPIWATTGRLHVADTVETTATNFGFFTPVYRQRIQRPEYLILAQSLHGYDQIADVADLFIQALSRKSKHIQIRGYRFRDDPRRLHPIPSAQPKDDPDIQPTSLQELAKQRRDARLIVISDWEIAFVPYQADQPQDWLKPLYEFEKRVWLCPGHDSPQWAERAKIQAQRLNMRLLPLSSVNVPEIVRWLSQDHNPLAPLGRTGDEPLPFSLTSTAESWLSWRPPHGIDLKQLLNECRGYLGEEGFLLLKALAVFPKPVWPLPYILDQQLFSGSPKKSRKFTLPWRQKSLTEIEQAEVPLVKEQRLIKIGRLPWSRHAYMPDYLRELLLKALTRAERKRIRQAWQVILDKIAINPDAKKIDIPIAASRVNKLELQNFLLRQEQENALDDAIFANILLGGKLGLLDFKLPQLFNKLLPNTTKLLDLGPVMKAAVLAGLSIWGMHYAWQTVGKQMLIDYRLEKINQTNANWLIELDCWIDSQQPNSPNNSNRKQLTMAMQKALGTFKFGVINITYSTKPQDFTDFNQNIVSYAPGGIDQAQRVQQSLVWTSYGAHAKLEQDSSLPPDHIKVRLVKTYQHGSAFNDELRYAYQKPEQSIGQTTGGTGNFSDSEIDNDPLEGWNRKVQSFNEVLDTFTFKPLAKVYKWLLPKFADQGVSNFYANLDDFSVAINDLLQFKLEQSGLDALRLLVNSTAGIGGFLDLAERIDLPKHHEDFDQTLAVWGVPSGNYLVLPVLGPNSVRGSFGFIGDAALFLTPLLVLLTWRRVIPFKIVIILSNLILLDLIDKRADTLSDERIVDFGDAPTMDRYDFIKNAYLQQRHYLVNDGNASAAESSQPSEKTIPFQEPIMVVVKPGSFQMGSSAGESDSSVDENPQHPVTIAYAFEIGQTEITVDQYTAFAQAAGRKIPDDNQWVGKNLPVTNVSFNDAQAYARWLSQQTGKDYRLPTEAEWEYVARAGTTTAYWWGNNIGKNNAACSNCGSKWDYKQAAPVASFKANRFGLYDTAGNVYEWTQDCWHENYTKAPLDGAAWLEQDGGDCDRRVVRGGSWFNIPLLLRSAYRYWLYSDDTYSLLGFRVARAL